MSRSALCVATALLIAGVGWQSASADGINVARFLINHQRELRQPKPAVRPFDAAFATLRAARAGGGELRVLMKATTRQRILDGRSRLDARRELLFDGKRAYLRFTTASSALRPQVTTSTVRVPLGRMFGWYGKRLLKSAFPALTPQKMRAALRQ